MTRTNNRDNSDSGFEIDDDPIEGALGVPDRPRSTAG